MVKKLQESRLFICVLIFHAAYWNKMFNCQNTYQDSQGTLEARQYLINFNSAIQIILVLWRVSYDLIAGTQ